MTCEFAIIRTRPGGSGPDVTPRNVFCRPSTAPLNSFLVVFEGNLIGRPPELREGGLFGVLFDRQIGPQDR